MRCWFVAILLLGLLGCDEIPSVDAGSADSAVPVDAPMFDAAADAGTTPSILSVALGRRHSCVLLSTGQVWCWGDNFFGQLGDGGAVTTPQIEPVAVLMLEDAVAIVAHRDTTCVIRGPEQKIWCWGANEAPLFGPIGTPIAYFLSPRELLGATERIESMSLFSGHLLAITVTGVVLSAGYNRDSQLGHAGLESNFLAPVEDLPAGPAVSVAASGITDLNATSFVAMQSGDVYCFGRNREGQCGLDPSIFEVVTPTLVPGLSDIDIVAADRSTACGVSSTGEVFCWGTNDRGQLGLGTEGGAPVTPARVPGLGGVDAISFDGSTVMVRNDAGHQIWAWGDNNTGNLAQGIGNTDPVLSPVRLFADATALYEPSNGASHSCVIERRPSSQDSLLCAGSNRQLQVGVTPESTRIYVYTRVPLFE